MTTEAVRTRSDGHGGVANVIVPTRAENAPEKAALGLAPDPSMSVKPEVDVMEETDDTTSVGEEESKLHEAIKLRELRGNSKEYPALTRQRWWQLWLPRRAPPPPKQSLEDAEIIPLSYVNFISKLTFWWVTPIMTTGFQRPLQATDLWKLDHSREAETLAVAFLAALDRRQKAAEARAGAIRDSPAPRMKRIVWWTKARLHRKLGTPFAEFGTGADAASRRKAYEAEWRSRMESQGASLTWALNDVITGFWAGGLFKVTSDTAQLMTPIVAKKLIEFSQQVYAAAHNGEEGPNIGRGIGMALGMWLLVVTQSVGQNQFFFRSMAVGVLARGTLISAVFQRYLALAVDERTRFSPGHTLTLISSDISRIDYCAQWFHACWTAPIQLLICLGLLIAQIGPSATVGFAVFLVIAPLQTWCMKKSFIIRKKSMRWTDGRAKLLRELLSSMQIIKVFTYELPFLNRLRFIRRMEMKSIRKILLIRAANQAMAFSVPTIASVLAFATYGATHKDFNPALIFTALALFNLLRQPLMFLPRALSSLTDAQTAMERLTKLFRAQGQLAALPVNPNLANALEVDNATFRWGIAPSLDAQMIPNEAFHLRNLSLTVPRGKLVGIVGTVGSGKSSLLSGIVGAMRLLQGSVRLGGRLAYCQQTAWIQNATVKDNILFGQPFDASRYWRAVTDACLVPDLEILPDGDLTEIGEKGVNLSGGQKQRINIARAVYNDADIILLDDPLSAVDAHVGRALFHDVILGLRSRGKTIVLVTHALHFLPQLDYIYVMNQGEITERGTYSSLVQQGGQFCNLVTDFGIKESSTDTGSEDTIENPSAAEEIVIAQEKVDAKPVEGRVKIQSNTRKGMGAAAGTGKLEGRLMVSEVRKTGAVGSKVYGAYLRAGRIALTTPGTIVFGAIMQAAQVLSTVWLTWWSDQKFPLSESAYEGLYAVLGVTQALSTFALGAALGFLSYFASNTLHGQALHNVFHAPMSVFDTQPLGRILGVFGKDIDSIDNQLSESLRMEVMTLVSLFGGIIVITVFLHYFILVIFVVAIGYLYFVMFYRASAREIKRLDGLLRGLLYSHISEALSGLATIQAYGEVPRFIKDNNYYIDLENRAYILTATNQRWLGVRLDFLGGLMVFAVAVMVAKGGGGILPSEIGLCLTYMTSLVQVFGMVVRQSAEVENNMNAVERILWYTDSNSLPQEPPAEIGETKPAQSWPAEGHITFNHAVMSYRPELLPALKDVSFDIRGGEKVGIVGRTGAGKTSITVALYRLSSLTSGRITIDDIDIASLGLQDLRSRIAIIPQDPVLFSGTLRTNLDPFEQHEDQRLYDALRRASLIDSDPSTAKRYGLDMTIEEEGSNLSVGERSLVSLARALVKDSKIVVLDEATAAVDLETDAKIQQTIHREFRGKTLLCIAHRLRTIISWDRILVMDAGRVQDFDTPLALYDKGGTFRSMCERSSITRNEIEQARQVDTLA